jgi:hypothetical protein
MKSNYKPIGNHIRLVDERNKGLKVQQLLGLSISKFLLLPISLEQIWRTIKSFAEINLLVAQCR